MRLSNNMIKKILICLLTLLPLTAIFSTGGGGIYYGNYQYRESFSNQNLEDIYYYGGFGYGSNNNGIRSGGFGMVMFSKDLEESLFKGAYGGVITGREVVNGPIVIALNMWTGFGYSNLENHKSVSAMMELNGEVGFVIFPWFEIELYGGIQLLSAFTDIVDSAIYTPVIGVRVVWGSFKK